MYKSKYKKILILCFIIIFVIMSIGTGILAGDTLHTEHCDIPNCSLCNLIHFASYFAENMIILVSNILIFSNNPNSNYISRNNCRSSFRKEKWNK